LSEQDVVNSAANGKMCKKCKTNQIFKQRCDQRLSELVNNVDKTVIKSKSKPGISIELPKPSYENVIPLGKGAYGEVRKISIDFARKTFFKSSDDKMASDYGTFLNFATEVAITKYLQDDTLFKVYVDNSMKKHTNILQCYGAFMSNAGQYSYLMREYNYDLTKAIEILKNNGYRGSYIKQCITNIYNDCKRGLQYMHFMSVTHNDFKSDNILITIESDSTMRATISDLGNATFSGVRALHTLVHDKIYMFQTNQYKSPELLVFLIEKPGTATIELRRTHLIDELNAKKMDMWAFAVTMIELANLEESIYDEEKLYVQNKNSFRWNSYNALMEEINKRSTNRIVQKRKDLKSLFDQISKTVFDENDTTSLKVLSNVKVKYIDDDMANELSNLSLFNFRKRNWNTNVYWKDSKKDQTLFDVAIVLNKKSNRKLERIDGFDLVFSVEDTPALKRMSLLNNVDVETMRFLYNQTLVQTENILKSFVSDVLKSNAQDHLQDYSGFANSVSVHSQKLFYHYLNHFPMFRDVNELTGRTPNLLSEFVQATFLSYWLASILLVMNVHSRVRAKRFFEYFENTGRQSTADKMLELSKIMFFNLDYDIIDVTNTR
jgi:serine/threonine protein kinase